MADAASHLTHSFGRFFLTHFLPNFSQTTPWRLLSLTSAFKHQITIILINKRSPKECTLQSARKIHAPVINGTVSVDGCMSP